ncbi:MAG: TIR domain-containing protein, partial [Roseiflexaceae bacterium]|nr:TIR domain-containing protein [Roseiflexaceae bacterium]
MTNTNWTEHHTQLRDTLADLYYDRDDMRRLIDEARLDRAAISLGDKAINTWHSIVREASAQDLLVTLIEQARVRHKNDSVLIDALNTFGLPRLALKQQFLCYAANDGADFALRLHSTMKQGGLRPWFDRNDTPAGYDPVKARDAALQNCTSVLLVLTPASAVLQSECAQVLRRALQYKKPIIVLRMLYGIEMPLLLGNRLLLDFTGPPEPALHALSQQLNDLATPVGQLRELEYRLADAMRELQNTIPEQQALIQQDIFRLEAEIKPLRAVVQDIQAANEQTDLRIKAALQRERQPERPVSGQATTKFINPPPLVAPSYFQDRHVETRLIAEFLRDPAKRLLTIVGRGGIGKTALVCRLLKALEAGQLPDDHGAFPVSGIVYLSAVGSYRISFPNLHAGLLKLLPADQAQLLTTIYQDPHKTVAEKLAPVCEACSSMPHPVVLLLDNLEDLVDQDSYALTDAEVDSAIRALLAGLPHQLKILITTRMTARSLVVLHPERQIIVPLDEGLPSPYAEHVLRAGDPTGLLGLRDASDARLAPACAFTRGYPRALEALTAALNADRASTLEELLAGPAPENVVEALVGQAYSRLDLLAQQVLQALAVFGRPVPSAAIDYLLQPMLPSINSTPVLNRLVNMRFVTKERGRYYMHSVDRAYALQRLTLVSDTGTTITLSALQSQAADYYKATRTPRAAWKNLTDLAPQLAEIDLRVAAGEYDSAANVLLEIDFGYLQLWGHARLLIEQHERLQGQLLDKALIQKSLGSLGLSYAALGEPRRAIELYEQALAIAREIGDRGG